MDRLEQAEKALKDLRSAIREGHEILQGFKEAIREAREFEKHQLSQDTIKQKIEDKLIAGLKEFEEALAKAISDATQATYDRFDLLASIMLGEDAESAKKGMPPIEELIKRYRATAARPPVAVLTDNDLKVGLEKMRKERNASSRPKLRDLPSTSRGPGTTDVQ